MYIGTCVRRCLYKCIKVSASICHLCLHGQKVEKWLKFFLEGKHHATFDPAETPEAKGPKGGAAET